MTTLTITAKGQVTFKRELMNKLGVGPGDRIEVEVLPDGEARIRPVRRSGSLDDFIGCLEDPNGPVLSQEEIKTYIEEAWAGAR